MNVTFLGKAITLKGPILQPGDKFPDFTLTDNELNPVKGGDLSGVRVFVVVPSLDTGVCDLEVKNFNKKAAELPGVNIYAVSLDLPFAQARWCGANGVSAIKTLSDYRDRDFGHKTGTYIEELALLTRAVFVVDRDGTLAHVEYVPEVSEHPDYEKIYERLKVIAK